MTFEDAKYYKKLLEAKKKEELENLTFKENYECEEGFYTGYGQQGDEERFMLHGIGVFLTSDGKGLFEGEFDLDDFCKSETIGMITQICEDGLV